MDDKIAKNLTIKEELLIDETTPVEIFSLTFFVPMSTLLLWLIATTFSLSLKLMPLVEAVVINLVLLLSLTSLCDYLLPMFVTLNLFLLILMLKRTSVSFKEFMLQEISIKNCDRKFVGDYRGHLLLATSICILAVDFPFFPERFAKTETYGWSVMDAGVGSFVLVHGLCSNVQEKGIHSLKKCMLSSAPLFMLGFVRLVVTTAVDYHKVVPEYGVHWNFFFTLACIKVICYLIVVAVPRCNFGLLATVVLTFHQLLLSKWLTAFILSDARDTFVEANKEGICSLLGFVSIYFYGVQLGSLIWKKRYKIKEYTQLFLLLCITGVSGWILMYLFHETVQPASRRMANLTYCIWVVSLTSLQIAVHLGQQLLMLLLNKTRDSVYESLLWKAINYNGLFYFLLANVMTGLVNLTINTEESSEWKAFLIMSVYLLILSASVIVNFKYYIQFKFW